MKVYVYHRNNSLPQAVHQVSMGSRRLCGEEEEEGKNFFRKKVFGHLRSCAPEALDIPSPVCKRRPQQLSYVYLIHFMAGVRSVHCEVRKHGVTEKPASFPSCVAPPLKVAAAAVNSTATSPPVAGAGRTSVSSSGCDTSFNTTFKRGIHLKYFSTSYQQTVLHFQSPLAFSQGHKKHKVCTVKSFPTVFL